MPQVSAGELKAYARLASSAADGPINTLLGAVEAWLAGYLGVAWAPVTVVDERVDGGGDTLYCAVRPVTAITQVVDRYDGRTVDAEDYYTTNRGAVREVDASPQWEGGRARYAVSYTGGYVAMPDQAKAVVLALATKYLNTRDGRNTETMLGGATVVWEKFFSSDFALLLRGVGCKDFA